MADIQTIKLGGLEVVINDDLGHMAVFHDGALSWDDLFQVKNEIWGEEIAAIEVYPKMSKLVNARACRHLWRMGEADFVPDLLGDDGSEDTLMSRCVNAWSEAREQG